jgi:hypothetical protein
MKQLRLSTQIRETGFLHRAGVGLALLACTAAFAVGLTAPAGAVASFEPHGSGVTPHVSASLRAHAVTPLTLANIVVTDQSTGNAAVYSYSSVAPNNSCSNSSTFICLTLSGGGAGAFTLTVGSPFQSGQVYDDVRGSATVSAGGASCGEFSNSGPASVFAVELDQYHSPGGQAPDVWASQFDCTNPAFDISGTIAYNIRPTDPENGYYVFGQAGEIAGFGNDNYLAYLDGAQYYNLNAPIVGMVPVPDGAGYWMVGSDGGVFSSGDAGFYGSTGNLVLNKPVVGMATTPDGKGYWFVASDGGIFSYGDAQFYGSTGNIHLNKPIVGMAATPDGRGYWLVASDGGIFSYGDAGFYGSTGSLHLNQPVVGMTPTPSGHGYWFVASDGGIFAYGDAGFYGSTGAIHLNAPIVGMAAAPNGNGYWFVASDGGVFNYGSAGFAGSLGGSGVNDVAGISRGM